MPPRSTGKKLSAREIELLREWVRQGARYARHWSYVKPVRPRLPEVQDRSWPRNEIDHFILARLEREGLGALARGRSVRPGPPPRPRPDRPAADAGGGRRFVSDPAPDAYERLVDRLLDEARLRRALGAGCGSTWPATPIRPATPTTRRARSGPTATMSSGRSTPNKPFDQFTIEQIAGDLLPEADRASSSSPPPSTATR